MRRGLSEKILLNLLAWSAVFIVAFPLLWTILTSLKPQTELFRIPPSILPHTVTFEHYAKLLFETRFLAYFANSVIVAVSTTVVVIAVAAIGAHSLVRFSYPGRERLAQLVLFTYLLPSVVLIIPLYLLLVQARHRQHAVQPDGRLHDLRASLRAVAAALLHGGDSAGSGGRGAGRRRLAHGSLRRRHPAAGAARHHLDRAVHLHPGLERIPLRAGAGEQRHGAAR